MPNIFFIPESYPFMYNNKKVGVFTVDCNENGDYIYTIDIDEDFSNEYTNPIWEFTDIDNNLITKEKDFIWHTSITKIWVEDRVFPPERQNADELLTDLNLESYDELNILKYTSAKSLDDDFWVDFSKNYHRV